MALVDVMLWTDQSPLPREAAALLAEAARRIDEFQHHGGCHGFVPSDYHTAYRMLRTVADEHFGSGALFCEWGSGFGVVTCLAGMLGFDACGIEIRAELVEAAGSLAEDFDSAVQFFQGSFIPEGGDACFDTAEDYAWLTTEAHAHAELAPDDFDLIYAYPWPDEEAFTADLFDRFARPGALLLTHHGGDTFRLRRKTRKATKASRR